MATSFNPVSVILLTYLLHFTFSNFFSFSLTSVWQVLSLHFSQCLIYVWLPAPFLILSFLLTAFPYLLLFYSYHLLSMPTQAHFFPFHLFPFLHIHFYDPTTKSLKLYVQNRKVPFSI